jgi:hypothetical protein
MWIASFRYDLWPSPKGVSSPTPENARERSTVPSHERLWLAGLLLVVVGWIILRLVLTLLAAN